MEAGDLERFLADALAEAGSRERADARRHGEVAAEEADLATIALDLAARGEAVVVATAAGRTHRGRVLAVGADFLVVREGEQPPVFLPWSGVALLRRQPGRVWEGAAPQSRRPVRGSLRAVLAGLAAEHPRVQLGLAGAAPVTGMLAAVGPDAVSVRLEADRAATAFVPLTSVAEVVLLDLLG